ncbi:Gam-like protein [Selenomonas sp. FOBRC9]|uniref:host-nuclease inhibitor Gam family protein n=1 Tax=Selenomonas sp. FOBRC9 TaxID=936573 RepID=UPI00027A6039|nr:host-nuclease inhibitor Gam family protein [Selenomonas sp. FOBRC9]EJP32294.1 Gam-like protein [Selenomonas sp. FOBRC9]
MMEAVEKKPFEVTDAASAQWALEKIAEKRKEREMVEDQYQKMVARYEKWRAESLMKLDEDEAFFEGLLRPWAEAELAGSKKKSVMLPSGRVGFRAGSKTYMMGGEKVSATNADLLAFVRKDDADYIERKESVRWGDYKKTLNVMEDGRIVSVTGQIIPGMTVTEGEPSFYVEAE